MSTCLSISLPVPPSVNALWRMARGRTIKSSNYRRWLLEADLAGLTSRIPRNKLDYPVHVTIVVRTGSGWRSNRDIDNVAKAILDWLVRWEVLAGDDCTIVQGLLIEIDTFPRARACVDVSIRRR
jgi:crossover junction endodeoxyribonuclease RusA